MIICNKEMKISDKFKKKLEAMIGIKNTEYTYIPGCLIQMQNTNIDYVNPHKIIIKKNNKEIVILSYGNYYEEDDAIFIYDINHKCTLNKLKEIMA